MDEQKTKIEQLAENIINTGLSSNIKLLMLKALFFQIKQQLWLFRYCVGIGDSLFFITLKRDQGWYISRQYVNETGHLCNEVYQGVFKTLEDAMEYLGV